MLRSMYSGIGGMKNFQTKLDVIGNNISNVNTYGFKKGRTTFKDLVSQQLAGASNPTDNRGGTNPQQIGLGGTMATVDTIHTQGSLQTTGRALDLGISGDGFFIVNDGDLSYYTRAGNFYLDREGTLVTGDGMKVQGYRPGEDGQIDMNDFGELAIQAGEVIPPQATTDVSLKGNLDANPEQPVTVQYSVVDSLGGTHNIEVVFERQGENNWTYTINGPEGTNVNNGNGNIEFDENGQVDNPTDPINNVNFTPGNGAGQLSFDIDFSSITQFSGSNTVDIDEINGNSEGFLESFNISQTGEINGVYTNGEVRVLGQIAMATFNNTGGLTKSGDNLFQVSNNSGVPNIGLAGEGRGVMQGSSLEMSNVDLSEEFTEMIVAQRGFQSNTRIITTSDEILQELVNLKR
ncbi:flagellar biosynthesis protein FlgE [Anaerobacillus arseniciselenatis]|uniref:Flagellar hook protein FlgE n=1 Tax=Anaerobacillus arseniciselenatis TaxID=85682 RepID=A0A1S2LBN2_9BACI|nr:flagellar hook protein FlgE [Anaerobacillus arseniciselenatis]OIJ09908.1 flagellar biosynthesis protein FlgE [Anaerobacillus arseniciselenatis]